MVDCDDIPVPIGYIGMVLVPDTKISDKWQYCEGQKLSVDEYPELADILSPFVKNRMIQIYSQDQLATYPYPGFIDAEGNFHGVKYAIKVR